MNLRTLIGFRVVVRDGGFPRPFEDFTRVWIALLDLNDVAPHFSVTPVLAVQENQRAGAYVGRLSATDPDSGDGGVVIYELANQTDIFKLNETTGDLYTRKSFDRERVSSYVVRVVMTDRGEPKLRGTGEAIIRIGDENDNGPYYSGNVSGVISEGSSPGVERIDAAPSDRDVYANANFTCTLTSGNELDRFVVDPRTGYVTATVVLDQEERARYVLGIRADDAYARSAFTYVHVVVGDSNDNSPVFDRDVYRGVVSEVAARGTFVLSVSATDADTGVNAEVTYSTIDPRFTVNASTGDVYIIGSVDRETNAYVVVNVTATDGAPIPFSGWTLLNITILDANDVEPVFRESLYTARMSESVSFGHYVTTVTASDGDVDIVNSNFTYVIEPGEGYDWFRVDPLTGVVTTQRSLDRERDSMPEFTLLAKDTGSPSLTGKTTIRVDLDDVNDSPPAFDQPLFTLNVAENSPSGSSVGFVTASDPDVGENATIWYRIVKDSSLPWSRFTINSTTGLITSKLTLNRETVPLYYLQVEAEDRGFPSLASRVNATVVVTDVNDNVPEFNRSRFEFSISEDASDGDEVGRVFASDRDVGTNAVLAFRFSGGRDYRRNPFAVDSATGRITKIAPLDREMISEYRLEIAARDAGKSPLETAVNVTIVIDDVNDNDPVFATKSIDVAVRENMGVGTHLATLVATDADVGSDGAIEYVLVPSVDSGNFALENETGVLKTARRLDREVQSTYRFRIVANNSLSSRFGADYADVTIRVLDLNDEVPHFEKLITGFVVTENTPIGSTLFRVPAFDDDEGRNGSLRFAFTFQSHPEQFILNETNGYVVLNGSLDREIVASYAFGVWVSDSGVESLNTSTIVYVDVLDENDEAPVFRSNLYVSSISYTTVISAKILDLKSIDGDTVEKSPLTYTIVKGNDLHLFSISPTGDTQVSELRVNASLLAYGETVHNLTIRVSDGKHEAQTSVLIDIYETSTSRPVFLRGVYAGSVKEGEASGKTVVTVAASPTGATYEIVSGNKEGRFAFDVGGVIRTTAVLDREDRSFYRLGVSASNSNGTTYCTVEIRVRDANDHAPTFVSSTYDLVVAEATSRASVVAQVRAVDDDDPTDDAAGIEYAMTASTNADHFRIDSSTGDVYPNRILDFEKGPRTYDFTVTATNHKATPHLKDTARLRIAIAESNDNAPQFEKLSFTVSVREDEPVNSSVITVSATDADFGAQNSLVTYTLSGDHRDVDFLIDSWTGEVTTGRRLDRERQSIYSLVVTATDDGNPARSSTVPLIIDIVDLNDNAPVWEQNVYNAELYENVDIGEPVLRVVATDRDHVAAIRDSITQEIIGYNIINGLVRYAISGGDDDGQFDIDSTTGDVTVRGELNREAMPSYSLTLNATDGGGVSTFAVLRIEVLDVNDNSPVFSASLYNATMPENGPIGVEIGTVTASDADVGVNGEFDYVVGEGYGRFDVNASTGVVFTTATLDREARDVYDVEIVAKDRGNRSLSSSTRVRVSVLDWNDNAPLFREPLFKANASENLTSDSFVVQTVASDVDLDENGTIFFEITDGNDEGNFWVENSTGIVRVATYLDYEMTKVYRLKVLATDQTRNSSFRLSSETIVLITVHDVNDNSPELLSDFVSNVSVVENAQPGTLVFTVSATDRDSGRNGELTYSFVGNVPSFGINSTSGEITTSARLDREARDFFRLAVKASDLGSPSKFVNAIVNVAVIDVNDNVPVFDSLSYEFSVPEHSALGAVVGTISASDRDIMDNAKLSYSLHSMSGYDECLAKCGVNSSCFAAFKVTGSRLDFLVGSAAGDVRVAADTDRENKSAYAALASATDHPTTGSSLTGYACVFVNVSDSNDHAPEFTLSTYRASLDENTKAGETVTTIEAVDKDIGTNAEVVYSIVGGSGNGLFRIDPVGGTVVSEVEFDRESGDSYSVVVQAEDKGDPPLSATVNLHVQIGDDNDNSPRFVFDSGQYYQATIFENQPSGHSVVRVSATDADVGENAVLTYSILSGVGSENFAMNSTTGVVTTTKSLDRESVLQYNLTILAADSGSSPQVTPASLFIIIADENDNNPTFLSSNYTTTMREEVPSGTRVLVVSAVDVDAGSNSKVSYVVDEQTPIRDGLGVDSTSGLVTVTSVLDREITDRQTATILAVDEGSPARTATVRVIVHLSDENDNSPLFTQAEFPTVVSETAPRGTVILELEATDIDADVNNSAIRYEFSSGNEEGLFQLDSVSGKISLDGVLDRESTDLYVLDVVARDLGRSPRSSSAVVIVNVQNENDNRPVFTSAQYAFDVVENEAIGVLVGRVSAQDIDNQNVSYLLVDGKGFSVDSVSGEVATNASFDYEKIQNIQLTVRALDTGLGNFTYTDVNVSIRIIDVNDNSPKFAQNSYNASIAENVTLGDEVILLRATDVDSGENSRLSFYLNRTLVGEKNHFAVNRTTGAVVVTSALDRETIDFYELEIVAMDHGAPSRAALTRLSVFVLDVNDNLPVVNVSNPFPQVVENDVAWLLVSQVTATDVDVGLNSDIVYSILTGDPHGRFAVNASTGAVYAISPLDREQNETYHLIIEVSDRGNPRQRVTTPIDVVVLDVNDNSPTFARDVFAATIREDVIPSSSVFTLSAHDPDKGTNSDLRYHISRGNGDQAFAVDETTGLVTTKKFLDRELRQDYSLDIQVSDRGTIPRTGTTSLNITVLDVNDNGPQFISSTYDASVPEDAAVGYPVDVLVATDADEGSNAALTYGISMGNDDGTFRVVPDTGRVVLNRSLDYEKRTSYVVAVVVSDGDFSDTTTLSVSVVDRNDHRPAFDFPLYAITVPASIVTGSQVARLVAVDVDFATNRGSLSYAIVSGNDDNLFAVGEFTAIVSTRSSLASRVNQTFSLRISASDGSLTSHANLTIRVVVDGKQPAFDRNAYDVNVVETTPVDSVVATLSASDAIDFNVTTSSNFEANSTGHLFLRSPLDFETKTAYGFTVTAISADRRTSSVFVYVNVVDVNDNAPVFETPVYVASISESSSVGSSVIVVTARDVDSAANSVIQYELQSDPTNWFVIDKTSGLITTKSIVDRERYATVDLNVSAINTPFAGFALVRVTIEDINDNSPAFDSAQYDASLSENARPGSTVARLTANDPDAALNGRITYAISSATVAGVFAVNESTGVIRTLTSLDKEIRSTYTLGVTATDYGSPFRRQGSTVMYVRVTDVNELAPVFDQRPEYRLTVPESNAVEAVVGVVRAVDPDTNSSAGVRYFVSSGNEARTFRLDGASGALVLAHSLDYEKTSTYNLTVVAVDDGFPPLNSTTIVRIRVANLNDHVPVFNQSSYEANVTEKATIGSSIVRVFATDPDSRLGVTYFLTSNGYGRRGEALFSIDSSSGVVFTESTLDRELKKIYTLRVTAIDSGFVQRYSTSVDVVVALLDVNDNAPTFVERLLFADVSRFLPGPLDVASFRATDPDEFHGNVEYSIVAGNDAGLFAIEKRWGNVTTTSALGENISPLSNLTIRASDGELNSQATLIVHANYSSDYCFESICTRTEASPCGDEWKISSDGKYCVFDYCLGGDVVCAANRSCVSPSTPCNGSCLLSGSAICSSIGLCLPVANPNDFCDAKTRTCFDGYVRVKNDLGSETCTNSSTLEKAAARSCTDSGFVYCVEKETCVYSDPSGLNPCRLCPLGYYPCPKTFACVGNLSHCCPDAQVYCNLTDRCINETDRCVYPNSAPVVEMSTVFMGVVTEEIADEGLSVEFLLQTSGYGDERRATASDVDDDLLGMAIVGIDGSSGKWEYAICLNWTDVCRTNSCCLDYASDDWRAIENVDDSHALLLPRNSRLRIVPKRLFQGAAWLRFKAWDGSEDGIRSASRRQVVRSFVTVNATVPFSKTSAFSSWTAIALALVHPTLFVPATISPSNLEAVLEDTLPIENEGSTVVDLTSGIDLPYPAIYDDTTVNNFPPERANIPRHELNFYFNRVLVVNRANQYRLQAYGTGTAKGIAVRFDPLNASRGRWQISPSGKTTTWTYLDAIVAPSQYVLLSEKARIRFLPDRDFSGNATLRTRPWDGAYNTTISRLTVDGILVVSLIDLEPFSYGEERVTSISITPVPDEPIVVQSNVQLDPISYRIVYEYDYLFTTTVATNESEFRRRAHEFKNYLVVTLGSTVDVRRIEKASAHAVDVSFEVDQDRFTFTEVYNLINMRLTTLRDVFGFNITDFKRTAAFGSGASCSGSQSGKIAGTKIGDLVARAVQDGDGNRLGAAITAAPFHPHGIWQYTSNRSSLWNPDSVLWLTFPPVVSLERAFLLGADDRIRFVPRPEYHWKIGDPSTTPVLRLKAWDGSAGGRPEEPNVNTDPFFETSAGVFSYDEFSASAVRVGCDGVLGSGLEFDACCVCGGDGSACVGCDGVRGSSRRRDSCDVCNGNSSQCLGCDFVPFSRQAADACGMCRGDGGHPVDCDGVCYGTAVVDACGACSGGTTGRRKDVGVDCAGTCNGSAIVDDCGDCVDGTTGRKYNEAKDCRGICNGPYIFDPHCGLCQHENLTTDYRDCAGKCFGLAKLDACSRCYDDPSKANATLDVCGVCDGDGTTCDGCDGVAASGLAIDRCGMCGGDDCSCFEIASIEPRRGPARGGTSITIHGAGFSFAVANPLPSQGRDQCGGISTDVRGDRIRARCKFYSPLQQWEGSAVLIDHRTIVCTTPDKRGASRSVQNFQVQVSVGAGDFTPRGPTFTYDDTDSMTVTEIVPHRGVFDVEEEVSVIGTNFIDSKEAHCLFCDVAECGGGGGGGGGFGSDCIAVPARFNSSSEYRCFIPSFSHSCQIAVNLTFDGQRSGIIASAAKRFTKYASAPVVVNVTFSDDANSLRIRWDKAIESATALDCRSLFDDASFRLVGGDASSCAYENYEQRVVRVLVGDAGTIRVGTSIGFRYDFVRARNETFAEYARNASGVVAIAAAASSNRLRPVAVIDGDSFVPICGTFVVSGDRSYNTGYGNAMFDWSIATTDSTISRFKSLQTELAAQGKYASNIRLYANLFIPNIQYYLELRVTNVLGVTSDVVRLSLIKSSAPLPTVAIRPLSPPAIVSSERYVFYAEARLSHCSNAASLTYAWSIVRLAARRDDVDSVVSLSESKSNVSALVVPAYTFETGNSYRVQVDVFSGATKAIADVVVVPVSGDIRAIIEGGNRDVGRDGVFRLDAKLSVDRGRSDVDAAFAWECFWGSVVCFDVDDPKRAPLLDDGATRRFVDVDAARLEPGETYRFAVRISKGSRVASAETLVTISPDRRLPVVKILPVYTTFWVGERLVLKSDVWSSLPVLNCIWQVEKFPGSGFIDLTDDSLRLTAYSFDRFTFNETDPSRAVHVFVNASSQTNLVLKPNVLTPSLLYRFKLTATNRYGSSSATIDVTPNEAPSSGTLIVTPSTGVALSTLFTLKAHSWSDVETDRPFLFRFGVLLAQESVHWLSGKETTNVLETVLPEGRTNGKLRVIVEAYDSSGARREATATVTVSPGRLLESSASLVQRAQASALQLGYWSSSLAQIAAGLSQSRADPASVVASFFSRATDLAIDLYRSQVPPTDSQQLRLLRIMESSTNASIDAVRAEFAGKSDLLQKVKSLAEEIVANLLPPVTVNTAPQNRLLFPEELVLPSLSLSNDDMITLLGLIGNLLVDEAAPDDVVDFFYDTRRRLTADMCRRSVYGESARIVGDVRVVRAVPGANYTASDRTTVSFGDELRDRFTRWNCSDDECQGVCIVAASSSRDWYHDRIGGDQLLDGVSAENLRKTIPNGNLSAIELVTDVVTVSLANPSSGSSIEVTNLQTPLEISFENVTKATINDTVVCLYRSNDILWRVDDVEFLSTRRSIDGDGLTFSCRFNHNSDFALAVIPINRVEPTPTPTTETPTTIATTEFVTTKTPTTQFVIKFDNTSAPTPTPTRESEASPSLAWIAGPVVAIVIIVVIALLVCFLLHNRKTKVGVVPALDSLELANGVKEVATESKETMKVIHVDGTGDRRHECTLNIVKSIRLRELRNVVVDEFEATFKNRSFYFLTRQLRTIEPEAETMQFVRMVYDGDEVFVRDVDRNDSPETKMHFCVCGAVAQFECSECQSQGYCSPECQAKHWEAMHAKECSLQGEQKRRSMVLNRARMSRTDVGRTNVTSWKGYLSKSSSNTPADQLPVAPAPVARVAPRASIGRVALPKVVTTKRNPMLLNRVPTEDVFQPPRADFPTPSFDKAVENAKKDGTTESVV